jgi:tetratricopeptide (TPR) repeat protein
MLFSKSRTVFVAFAALSLLLGGGKNGFSAEDQPAFDAISTDIQAAVKALEYPDEVGQDFVKMLKDWKCIEWTQKLSQTKRDLEEKKITVDQVAQVEEEVAKELFQTIGKEIACDDDLLKYFDLAKVISKRKANSVGYSQVYSMVGHSLGLFVKVICALEPPNDPLPSKKRHLDCFILLSNGKEIIADFACNSLSKSFVFKEEFAENGIYWEAKDKSLLGIHSRIQVSDDKGLAAMVYYWRGSEIKNTKIGKDVISYLTKSIELNAKFTLAYTMRANVYARSGDTSAALADISKALALDPNSAEVYCSRGFMHFYASRFTDAHRDFEKALSINPNCTGAYYGRGAAYTIEGKYAEAIAAFNNVLELDPQNASGYCGRGRAEILLGKLGEAKKDLLKVVELEPELKEIVMAISDYYSLDIFPSVL